MSNPSVTATISANDQASPKLRELLELTKKIENTAKAAFKENGGNALANSYRQATSAAQQHLTVLEKMHSVHAAIAKTVAGYAAAKGFHKGIDAVKDYVPYERERRFQTAAGGYDARSQRLLEEQRRDLAVRKGIQLEDSLHAQQEFTKRNYSAPITAAATGSAIQLSRSLGVPAEAAARMIEGMTFGRGVTFTDPAQTTRETMRSADIATVAAKKGAMSGEDIQQFSKYSSGMVHAANISQEQAWGVGMTLKKMGVGGDESGVFTRQLAARIMAPTKAAHDAMIAAGINYDDFAKSGNVSVESIDKSMRRRFGKGLSEDGRKALEEKLNDKDFKLDRDSFGAAVHDAMGGSGMSKQDQKLVQQQATRMFDMAKTGLNGGGLLEAVLSKMSPQQLQQFLGDKQGGRGNVLLTNLEAYQKNKGEIQHSGGLTDKIAEERQQGLAAATDRLAASFDALSKSMVDANSGWLTPLVEAGAKVAGFAAGLGDATKIALSFSAGAAGVAAMASMASTAAGVITGLNSLSVSANAAAASLARVNGAANMPGGIIAGGSTGAFGKIADFAAKLATLTTAIGLAASALTALYEYGKGKKWWDADSVKDNAANNHNPRMGGGKRYEGEQAEFWKGIPLPAQRVEVLPGPARMGGGKHSYIDPAGRLIAGEQTDSGSSVWDTARTFIGGNTGKKGDGFEHVDVSGTVSGSAEIHNIVEVRPGSALLDVVNQARSIANIGLNGKLGTSMQGPGDNATKPSQGTTMGAQ